MANGKASGIVLGLPHPFRQRLVPGLGLHYRQLGVPVLEDVVGGQGLATLAGPFQPTQRNRVLPANPATLDDTPPRGLERRVNVFRSGLGFVHGSILELTGEGVVEEGFLQVVEGNDLLPIGRRQRINLHRDGVEMPNKPVLLFGRRKANRQIA